MGYGDYARQDDYAVDPMTGMPMSAPELGGPSAADAYKMGGLAAMDQYREVNPEKAFGAYDKRVANQRAFDALPTLKQEPLIEPFGGMLLDQQIEQDKELAKMFVPTSPLDAGLMALGGPFGKLAKTAALGLGAILQPGDAEAGPLGRLFTPSGRIAERQASGFSKIKGGTPADAMNWRLQHSNAPVEQRTAMSVDKALRVGDEIIPIVGDDTRKLQQGYLTEIGGQRLSKPVPQEGGFDFALGQPVDPRTGLQDVWGNAASAATSIDKLAQAAAARGNRPVIMSTTMSKTGGDFSNQFYQPTFDLLKRNPPDKKLAAELDTFMRTDNTAGPAFSTAEFPGFAAKGVWDVLDNAGGALRAKMMKALDRKSVIDAGGPDIGQIRVANANPDLYNTPAGYMGYHIANVAPGQTGVAAHSAYPIATRGSDVRGFGGSVPGELVLRDLSEGLDKMAKISGSPQYLNRMDYYAIRPPAKAAEALGMKPLPKTQVVDQQMIDAVSVYVEKHGLKSIPPAMLAALYGREQFGGLAAQDSYVAQ